MVSIFIIIQISHNMFSKSIITFSVFGTAVECIYWQRPSQFHQRNLIKRSECENVKQRDDREVSGWYCQFEWWGVKLKKNLMQIDEGAQLKQKLCHFFWHGVTFKFNYIQSLLQVLVTKAFHFIAFIYIFLVKQTHLVLGCCYLGVKFRYYINIMSFKYYISLLLNVNVSIHTCEQNLKLKLHWNCLKSC